MKGRKVACRGEHHSAPGPAAEPQRVWRCAEERDDAESFREAAAAEFPTGIGQAPRTTRREFLALTAAAAAMSGGACVRTPREEIVPYVRAPEHVVPGKPLFYATVLPFQGCGLGVLVEQHMGRPTKVEGNPDHPASLGATDATVQASVLTLYDPDRSQGVLHAGEPAALEGAYAALGERMERSRERGGAGLRILTEGVSSPTLVAELERLLEELPEARWHTYDAVSGSAALAGTRLALGTEASAVYDFSRTERILALDADFLSRGPAAVRSAHDYAERRRVWRGAAADASMARLYAVGPTPTATTAVADHWLPMRAGEVARFAATVAKRLGVAGPASADAGGFPPAWVEAVARDLDAHRGRSVVVAGDDQPPEVHALSQALNVALENVGQTVHFIAPPRVVGDSLAALVSAMNAGEVESLIVIGANPVYSAPADLEFASALARVPFRVHLGMYADETAEGCDWHLPEAHPLESWGDARAYDGTASLQQPLIEPLYGGITALDLIATLQGRAGTSTYELVQEHWREIWQLDGEELTRRWNRALHDGVIEGTAFSGVEGSLSEGWSSEIGRALAEDGDESLELVLRPDPTMYDGRFANNGWLQELPKPLTSVTWDNVAVFGEETARGLGLKREIGQHGGDVIVDLVELEYGGRTIEAPAWIMPGHAEKSVTVYLGYGRRLAGRLGSHVGTNAFALRTSDSPWFGSGLRAVRTGRTYRLASTQLHHVLYGRDIIQAGTLEEYRRDPDGIAQPKFRSPESETRKLPTEETLLPIVEGAAEPQSVEEPVSLYPEYTYPLRKWGMVIDLSVCTGCNACVTACQAENNIPVVGKREVLRGREMHWLRVDTYHEVTESGRFATYFQPVPCMHCEKAPCESVCPVNATVHSDEGLNDMNYARCVGTRYCSNNCPYKVRRFNFFEYADWDTEALEPLWNPDVTVRSRGVMEKCTYCVQRINAARIHAEKDERPPVQNRAGEWLKPIYENELLTACQAVCPAQAITFGDLNDEKSQVSAMTYEQPLNYGLLAEELGTRPRTTYLAAVRNPHPAIG